MSNQEILVLAIDKAQKNGWYDKAILVKFIGNSVYFQMSENSYEMKSYNDILFDKDFAKALWGEEYIMNSREIKEAGFTGASSVGYMVDMIKGAGWKHHLKEMVISPDPIKYLKENI